jgi:uncharacterized membrane protein YhaH (DUF805 family)
MHLFEHLFSASGRIGRLTYLGYSTIAFLAMLALTGSAFSLWQGGAGPHALLGVGIAILAILGSLWTGLALTIKRLHDLGYSGYNIVWGFAGMLVITQILAMFPVLTFGNTLNVLISAGELYLLLMPGEPRENAYGAAF